MKLLIYIFTLILDVFVLFMCLPVLVNFFAPGLITDEMKPMIKRLHFRKEHYLLIALAVLATLVSFKLLLA